MQADETDAEVQDGRMFMDARWAVLQEECDDGSRRYSIPTGPAFTLPLDTCLFCDVNVHIKYNRLNFHVQPEAIASLEQEIEAVRARNLQVPI